MTLYYFFKCCKGLLEPECGPQHITKIPKGTTCLTFKESEMILRHQHKHTLFHLKSNPDILVVYVSLTERCC